MIKTPKHILVVDDEPEVLELLERGLKQHGFLVQTTRTAEQAFQKLSQKTYHALITDIQLPGMNGTKLIAHVRKNAKNPGMPVFAMTSSANASELNPLAALKVMDVVTKPFETSSLVTRIKAAIIESQSKTVFSSQILFETIFQSISETISHIMGERTRYGMAVSSVRSERQCEVSATLPFTGKGFMGFFAISMNAGFVDILEDNVLGVASSGAFADPNIIGDIAQDIANRALGIASTRLEKFNVSLLSLPANVSVGSHHTVIYRTENNIIAAPLLIKDNIVGTVQVCIKSDSNSHPHSR
jgi:DNA-binding response OmpR family regulator